MNELEAHVSNVTATYLAFYNKYPTRAVKDYSKVLKVFIDTVDAAIDFANPDELTYENLAALSENVENAFTAVEVGDLACDAHKAAVDAYLHYATALCTKTVFKNEWLITPTSSTNVATGEYYQFNDPIYRTIGANKNSSSGKNKPRLCKPGDDLLLAPGQYPYFRCTHTYDKTGIDKEITIHAEHPDTAFINPNPVGGSHTFYLEWAGAWTLKNINFLGDDIAAVMTENPYSSRFAGKHPGTRDVRFYDCSIDGQWSAHTDLGPQCKWGVLSYGLGLTAYPGQPGFVWSGGSIKGIKEEHAFYFHNIQGDVVLENIAISHCGRTAVQIVSRDTEGPQGKGNVKLSYLDINDVCLEQSGGGYAITCAGWHDGLIKITGCRVQLGCDLDLHAKYQANITGAFVAHQGGGALGKTKHIVIKDGDFEVGKYYPGNGPARRACVDVSAVETFELLSTRIYQHPGTREALSISPGSIGHIVLDSKNDVTGACLWGGTKYTTYQALLAAVATDPKVTII